MGFGSYQTGGWSSARRVKRKSHHEATKRQSQEGNVAGQEGAQAGHAGGAAAGGDGGAAHVSRGGHDHRGLCVRGHQARRNRVGTRQVPPAPPETQYHDWSQFLSIELLRMAVPFQPSVLTKYFVFLAFFSLPNLISLLQESVSTTSF